MLTHTHEKLEKPTQAGAVKLEQLPIKIYPDTMRTGRPREPLPHEKILLASEKKSNELKKDLLTPALDNESTLSRLH